MACIPNSAVCYPDSASHAEVEVVENVRLALDTWRLRLATPAIARRIVPGQFVMVRLAGSDDPLLARPLALYDTWENADGLPAGIDIVHLVVGKLTGRLAECRQGDRLEIWGPLGNGFTVTGGKRLVMVAGGIGQTPFLALARECLGKRSYGEPSQPRGSPGGPTADGIVAASGAITLAKRQPSSRVTLCYGVRKSALLAGVDDFRDLGVDVRLATEDGSVGRRGLVTDLLDEVWATEVADPANETQVVACGPEKMLEAVAERCLTRGVPCQISLETPMACGIGICFSCVVRVRDDTGGWDYRRTCVEGPVFDAAKIEF